MSAISLSSVSMQKQVWVTPKPRKAPAGGLEAVKPYYDAARYAGLACAMKNAGVGVGIPDTGRCRV